MSLLQKKYNSIRHPEKINKPDNISPKIPEWIRVKAPNSRQYNETRHLMRGLSLNTVCEEAACPNIGECWEQRHATVMILGDVCTRACSFCNVATGRPRGVDVNEPARVADAVSKLGLRHVVITSVDRDDLDDGGAFHFSAVVQKIRKVSPDTTIEILTPDFLRKKGALETVVKSGPNIFNHNLETVPRLYPSVRPGAKYAHSLGILKRVKYLDPMIFTKSGLMVGLGEKVDEIYRVMDEMRSAEVDFITIGQYLQPTPKHHRIHRFYQPDEFQKLTEIAVSKGFLCVSATPLTRSSYHADDDFKKLLKAKAQKQDKILGKHAQTF